MRLMLQPPRHVNPSQTDSAMDLAPLFNDCLKRRETDPIKEKKFRIQDLDGFLKEAYTLNSHIADLTTYLRSIRGPYLSTSNQTRRKPAGGAGQSAQSASRTPLTDADRQSIDATAKRSIRDLNARITQLASASAVQAATLAQITQKKRDRNGLGGLARWAAGGGVTAKSPEEQEEDAKVEALKMHREGVIWYLQRKLGEVTQIQSEMMEVRITREVEKSKSVLYKARGVLPTGDGDIYGAVPNGSHAGGQSRAALEESEKSKNKQDDFVLTEEQMQLFAQENQDMLKHYEDTLDQVRSAEKSLLEISELQTTLAANLEQQSEQIDLLVQNSYLTKENVGSGNKELKRASERKSTAQMAFYFTVALCGFLVTWDLVF